MEKVLKGLIELGLTVYEANSYRALIERSVLTAVDVGNIAGIPRTKVYHVLKNLSRKGLCFPAVGSTVKYKATDPVVLETSAKEIYDKIEENIKNYEDKLAQTSEIINSTIAALSNIYERGQANTDPVDYIEIIKKPALVHKQYEQLLKDCRHEILSLVIQKIGKVPQHLRKSFDKILDSQIKQIINILKKGVKIKCVYDISMDEDMALIDAVDQFVEAGQEVKVLQDLPMRLHVFDSKVATVTLVNPVTGKPSLTEQVIRHPAMVESQKMYFESLWEKAEDYKDFRKRYVYENRIDEVLTESK